MAETEIPYLVVGAGPAGLAAAAQLQHHNLPYKIVEQSSVPAPRWHDHYDRLHLHTVKEESGLPFRPLADSYPRYPSREQMVLYFQNYARQFNIVPLYNTAVTRITRDDHGRWRTKTKGGRTFVSTGVIVATGFNRVPHFPTWPGMAAYTGRTLHSRAYKNGRPCKGQDVLVIGMGNSGAEIALDLHQHGARPYISVRGPVNIVPRDFMGRPTQRAAIRLKKAPSAVADGMGKLVRRLAFGDLSKYGLKFPDESPAAQLRERAEAPVLDVGTVDLIKQREIIMRPAVEAFTSAGVRFADGRTQPFTAVILATGYRPNVEAFIPEAADLLNQHGHPKALWGGGRFEGLYFLGFDGYSNGILRSIRLNSYKIVDRILEQRRR